MSSDVSEGVVQMGKLYVHIAENGRSIELDCDEDTLVETVQKRLQSDTRIHLNEQLLLCLHMKLEPQQLLSVYRLPSSDREVFLFNKARMRSNSTPPEPEQVDIIDIPDPPLPSSSHDPHPLDDASDPALKALPSYERQFRYHFQQGKAIYNRSLAMLEICYKLFREQKVQERALEIARGNLDHIYRMISQNYKDFMNYYLQQRRSYSHLLMNFGKNIERLRSCKLLPALQIPNRKCLLDFLKEEDLRKLVEDFNISHKQFENKVTEFKQEFGDLEQNVDHLFSSKASFLIKELELTIKDHQQHINEQRSIMQALSKDVNTVKKLVDDCLSSQLASSLRPHDAVSALGPMYDGHDKSYLPKMQTCELSISELLGYCRNKKNEMNIFVHNYMQKMAYIQYTIKDVRFKFSVFQEALKRQSDQFEQLKVVRGIGPAYRACLAEVVRRKATMKLFMGMAGLLAERIATKREEEVRRREEFLKLHSLYIPRDVLASMGLYDTPSHCDVNIAPFDMNLIDVDISDVDRYAPESLLGQSFRNEKMGTLKGSNSMSNDSTQSAVTDGSSLDFHEKSSAELLEDLDFIDIAGTSKIEVENARLKAELASKIAIICSMCPEFDFETFDDNKIDSFMKEAEEKTSEALRLKDEYGRYLHSLVKARQMQCESYERRIQELEQRLADQHQQRLSTDEDVSNLSHAIVKTDESTSEISGTGVQMLNATHEDMYDVSCASSSLNVKQEIISGQGKMGDGLDDNMSDSSGMLNTQLDSSMRDPHRDELHHYDKNKKDTSQEGEVALGNSSMAVSISQPNASGSETAAESELELKVLELQSALTEKSNQLNDAENKLKAATEETARLGRELEISHKLLEESQMNCAHLENCLHEAREEAQTHLCTADQRAADYGALRASAVKMRGLFERLRNCILSGSVAVLSESLNGLTLSLATCTNEMEEDGSVEFRECVRVLAEKVGTLSRNRAELLERFSKAEKELEEKKELINTLYIKNQHEKQTNKERISFGRLEVHEIAAFVLNAAGHYEAVNRNCPYYYLSAESVALFADHLPSRPNYIIGQIVHIERQIVKSPSSMPARTEHLLASDAGTSQLTLSRGSSSNQYGLPIGCEYFIVTVAMLPDTTIYSLPAS
ncbi:scaffold/adaptor protein [Lithospermum erythrorhizon]|uniref:Scaffold/adaptor protein n=1 Tax=Lithospermum erythrorhizon TaxID=34254 RepID=A0AAV3PGW1_LITER